METTVKAKKGEKDVKQALDDYRYAYEYKRKYILQADQDFEFALGAQWDDDDVTELEDKGVLPLTINKIKPIIRLMKGIESQNRSESKAFPEGGEDSIKAEIATRLIKNAMKGAEGDYKVSEVFSDGNICGESWFEPYLDWSDSLIAAKFGLRKSDYWAFCWDPNSKEYDLSDAEYLCKTTFDLTKDQILSIYPDAEDLLEDSESGKLDTSLSFIGAAGANSAGVDRQAQDYNKDSDSWDPLRPGVPMFDLLEYYYKKYVSLWDVVDARTGKIFTAKDKAEAENYANTFNARDPEGKNLIAVVRRRVPEIWVMAIVGGVEDPLAHERAWSYPGWKGWPAIPYFAERTTARLKNNKRHLAIQGITRDIKDLNRELNKRRTQELRHLNQSANSGWLTPENAWVDRDDVEEFGATPGVNLEYKLEIGKPERIFPTPLSQGHAQLAEENSRDMKEVTGINADLLAAQTGGQDSGRAIALRQKQGLVMVQGFFDNLARSKKTLAKFILSQLTAIYTTERAMRVCGDSFIRDNFTEPVMGPPIDPKTGGPIIDPATGQPLMNPDTGKPIMVPQIDMLTGQPKTFVNTKAATQVFEQVLNDKELATYDVAIGETISQDTVKYANFLMLMEMAGKGIPIPPEVLIDESMVADDHKAKIKSAIERASAAAAQNPPKGKSNG